MKSVAIFDMDGLLINSEPFWEKAEIDLFKEYGISISLELCEQVKGFRVQETIDFYRTLFPSITHPTDFYVQQIVERVKILMAEEGRLLPGVDHAIALCRRKGLKLAVASSSPMDLIQYNLEKVGIHSCFDLLISGEHEPFGKPHPAIFLTVAKKMLVNPIDCIVFEDSLNGVIAGKAARMKVIAVPDQKNKNNPKFAVSDCVLNSLKELTENHLD